MNRRADSITARIAAVKRRLLKGGVLQEVQWGIPDPPLPPPDTDVRGRRTFTFSTVDALIEKRPALDRGRFRSERSDDTVLIILDPLAITTEHLFRWGDPPNTYSVKAVEGLLKDEETGTRYASEVTVIR